MFGIQRQTLSIMVAMKYLEGHELVPGSRYECELYDGYRATFIFKSLDGNGQFHLPFMPNAIFTFSEIQYVLRKV